VDVVNAMPAGRGAFSDLRDERQKKRACSQSESLLHGSPPRGFFLHRSFRDRQAGAAFV